MTNDDAPLSACTRSIAKLAKAALHAALAIALTIVSATGTDQAAAQSGAVEGATYGQPTVQPGEFSGDLSTLPVGSTPVGAPKIYRPRLHGPPPTKFVTQPPAAPSSFQPIVGASSAPMPGAIQNFGGVSFNDLCTGGQCGAGWPPDPNGDVGPNHYIEAVNDAIGIYSKTGALLASFTEDNLWSGVGSTPCNGNSQGDPVVVYDWLADRFVITWFAFPVVGGQPASPFYQCIAASKTGDPVAGGWWLYAIRTDTGGTGQPRVGDLNDYAKFGLWHDCLYMGANLFRFDSTHNGTYDGVLFASFSRANLYSGSSLTFALGALPATSNAFTLVPSNNQGTGANAAQPGTPNYFVSESGSAFAFEVRKFTAGTNCGAGGTLSTATNVSHTAYTVEQGAIVPQPNTSRTLDMIDDRVMQKVPYRKIGNTESLWVTHPVGTTASSTGQAGMHWAQLNVTGGAIATTPVQQQIYAPDSTLYRFMGSLAVDSQGNMALGYTTSNGTAPNYPSIAYSGRLATDPLNTMPQTEVQLIAGSGSQLNNCGGSACDRWGDYSAMSLDPADGCTFWYVNEYYGTQTNGNSGNWQTRIGSFRFPSCAGLSSTTTTLASSLNPSTVGASVTFTATVSGSSPTGNVSFTENGSTVCGPGTLSGSPRTASCSTSSLTAGSHSIIASYAGDASNAPSTSLPLTQVINGVPATVTFVGTDTATQGNWRGVYGGDGYAVLNDSTSYPAYAQVTPNGQASYVWDPQPTDTRALQRASTGRIAACWYTVPVGVGSSFTVDVNLTDQTTHRVALYMLDWDSTSRVSRVDVLDASSQQVLSTQNVQSYHNGVYLIWNIRGHVTFRITSNDSTNAVISGIFFDPTGGTPTFAVSGNVTSGSNALSGVGFTATGTGTSCSASDGQGNYSCTVPQNWSGTVTPSLSGYTFTPSSRSYSNVAANQTAQNYTATAAAGTTVTFVGTDTATQGNWRGVYGGDGYAVLNDSTSYPAYAQVTPNGQASYVWDPQPTDTRALQRASTGRIAACWYTVPVGVGSSFTVDVNLTDQTTHRVALYMLDWDSTSRVSRVDVLDASSQQVLSTQNVQSYHNGVYLIWNIRGHVTFRITSNDSTNAVISGIFFDPTGGTPTFAVSGNVTSGSNALSGVGFTATGTGTSCSASDGQGNYSCTVPQNWSGTVTPSLSGYTFTPSSRSYSNVAANQTAQNYTATAAGGTTVTFVGTDTATQGNWRGVYGGDGYAVLNDSTSYPAYAQVTPNGQASYVWDPQPTDTRALQRASTGRIAACWYTVPVGVGSSFTVDVNLTDQTTHRVALYMLDWDSTSRVSRVDVLDASSQQVLSTQNVQSYHNGVYLIWNIRGHVTFRITSNDSTNAVISGIFFDP